jgi:tetratricopeptide (TPR) repeat protein
MQTLVEEQPSQHGSLELTRQAYQELHKGEHQKAISCFESAAEKARDEGDNITMISCYLNAGACLVSRGKLEEGNKFLLTSYKLVKALSQEKDISRELEEDEGSMIEIRADIYYNLGVAAQKMDNLKQAVSCFKASAELYLKSECKLHAAESLTGLARCRRQSRQSDKEITCLVTAQQLYHKMGRSFNEAEVCLELARTYLREERLEDCKEMLSTAKLLCLRVDDRGLKGSIEIHTVSTRTSLIGQQASLGHTFYRTANRTTSYRAAREPL